MNNLSQKNFFFFCADCSNMNIQPGSVEHGYLAILNRDLDTAQIVFENIDSPRGKWGRVFVSILKGYMKEYPTYFQIRNFLEIDLDFLLKNELIDYAEQFLGALELLSTVNQETFKFTARVMFENKLLSSAYRYMERSKQIYYNDPELHFMFARYYYDVHNLAKAYSSINECLNLLPEYYPALCLKERIEETEI